MSLTDWAAQQEPRPSLAWIKSIPEWDEVREAYEAGVTGALIRRWLIEVKGYDPDIATESRVNDYLRTKLVRTPK